MHHISRVIATLRVVQQAKPLYIHMGFRIVASTVIRGQGVGRDTGRTVRLRRRVWARHQGTRDETSDTIWTVG